MWAWHLVPYLPAHPTWFALAGTKHARELFFPAKLRAY